MKTPQIIYDMPAAEYRKAPGLSHSAMKDLLISDLRFWHCNVRPDREAEESTSFMDFGNALHSATLDSPETFDSKFACAFDPAAHEGILETIGDMREWLWEAKGVKAKGTKKEEVAAQCRAYGDCPKILMDEEKIHFAKNDGKIILSVDDWKRLAGCVQSLESEPEFRRLRSGGHSEVSYFVTDPDTGVLLKARMDYVTPKWTLDIKTFSQKGKPIARTVTDALLYEGYLRQFYAYSKIRNLAGDPLMPFYFIFIESEKPHEVRILKLIPKRGRLYFDIPEAEVNSLIWRYANLSEKYGDREWKGPAEVDTVTDDDIRGLAY